MEGKTPPISIIRKSLSEESFGGCIEENDQIPLEDFRSNCGDQRWLMETAIRRYKLFIHCHIKENFGQAYNPRDLSSVPPLVLVLENLFTNEEKR